jgi:GNAT superfamily N-acetyltransferase
MSACLARCARWGGTRVLADGALPVPGVYGVPAQWPHIEALYRRSGFAAPDDAVEIVHLLDVNRGAGRRPAGAGLTLERSVGTNGTRFSAVHGGEAIGYLEVEVLDGAERHPRGSGLADVGNLHVRPDRRRQGVATLLLGEAVHWLRLGRVDRLLHYARSDETALLAFVERAGFEELTRTRRGWERSP